MLLFGRLLAGTGGALVQIVVLKMATERITGNRMSTATATVLASWPLGIALALAVLGAVGQWAGWRAALAVAALHPPLALAFAARATKLFPESLAPPGSRPRDFAGSQLQGMLPALGISVAWLLFDAGFSGFGAFTPPRSPTSAGRSTARAPPRA